MKCSKCGNEIKKPNAKFCPNCGEQIDNPLSTVNNQNLNNSNKNILIVSITAIIVVIIIAVAACYVVNPSIFGTSTDNSYSESDSQSSVSSDDSKSASEIQSTQEPTKSWESIGRFDGSGSGTKTITVPAGDIRIDLSAFPIKNYATNHLYVSGSNGKSAALDWGPKSAVATHSDSISFTSSSETTFTIDYYETVSWQVEVYRYQ